MPFMPRLKTEKVAKCGRGRAVEAAHAGSSRAGLPTSDLEPAHSAHFFSAGAVGLEPAPGEGRARQKACSRQVPRRLNRTTAGEPFVPRSTLPQPAPFLAQER